MARGLSSALVAQFTSTHTHPVTFASLAFSSGTVYVHDDIGTLTWGSQDWLGVGSFGRVSGVEEGMALSPFGLDLVLSGIDPDDEDNSSTWPDFLNEIMNNDYFQREVILYIGARNTDSGALVADPDELWRGVMENAALSKGREGDQIVINCESELGRLERANNLLFTNSALQSDYSGDLFFQFLQKVPDMKPVWRGRNNQSNAASEPTLPPHGPDGQYEGQVYY